MTSITFDTHASIKKLISAGADERLAEAIVSEISHREGDLVIQKDLRILEQSLLIKLTGVVIVATGILFTLLQLFPPGSLGGS